MPSLPFPELAEGPFLERGSLTRSVRPEERLSLSKARLEGQPVVRDELSINSVPPHHERVLANCAADLVTRIYRQLV